MIQTPTRKIDAWGTQFVPFHGLWASCKKARSENTERASWLNLSLTKLLRAGLLFFCLFLGGFGLGGLFLLFLLLEL
jgi:hypothetical protein